MWILIFLRHLSCLYLLLQIHDGELSQDQELHDQLVEKLKASILTKEKKQAEINTSSRGYLEFLALCMEAKCSFRQIHEIDSDLKKMYGDNNLDFLKLHAFTQEEVSLVSRYFGDSLLDETKKDLMLNNYSLYIDNSTITGKSISVLEAGYLKTEVIDNMPVTQICNKVKV